MKLRFHQELFSLHITSQIIKPTLSKTNRSLSSLLGPIKVMESRLKIEHSLWIRRRPNLLSPWRNRLSHVLQWSFLYGRSSQKPCERLNKEWFKKLQIDCCTNYYTYFLCSGPDVGSHTCITYDAVNQAYLDARQRIRECFVVDYVLIKANPITFYQALRPRKAIGNQRTSPQSVNYSWTCRFICRGREYLDPQLPCTMNWFICCYKLLQRLGLLVVFCREKFTHTRCKQAQVSRFPFLVLDSRWIAVLRFDLKENKAA